MDDIFKKAEALFSQGQPEAAEEILTPLLDSEDGSRAKAANYLGIIRQSQNRAEEAGALFTQALAAAPGDQEIRGNLAFNLIGRGQWAEAKEQLQKLLAVNQNEAKLWTLLAKAEQGLGNPAAAVEFLDKALFINPQQPDLKEARDKLAAGENSRGASAAKKPSVLMCCQKSLEHFALGLCAALEKKALVTQVVADSFGAFHWPIEEAENVWLEWGTDLAIAATKEPGLLADKKKVILRLHSFEILSAQAGEINYDAVSDVVFVSHSMRRLFQRRFPGRLMGRRSHVIHNGIDLQRFPFIAGKGRKKIAFVGQLDAKKDPMLMLHAFTFLRHRHPELELHVAGGPDNNRYYIAMPDFLAKNGLDQESAHFYGHVKDMPQWLADKDFILCTSPFEAQGVGLLEAMHRGLRPLIYSFPGAEELYPAAYLWRNFDELEALLPGGPEPEEVRDFVAEKYSMTRQADNFLKILIGDEEVVEERPVPEAGHAG